MYRKTYTNHIPFDKPTKWTANELTGILECNGGKVWIKYHAGKAHILRVNYGVFQHVKCNVNADGSLTITDMYLADRFQGPLVVAA